MMNSKLELVKNQKWFYEFSLPDGTKTNCYLQDFVRPVHHTREKALRFFLSEFGEKRTFMDALDISCHEGYYSNVLAEYFDKVIGIDKNEDSILKAKLITEVLTTSNISYFHTSLENCQENIQCDFVLCYGLIYHIENPIEIFRKLASITKEAICIETQILPVETHVQIEDGSYLNQRETKGTFGLCWDYPSSKEGGLTELALVPSRDALVNLLAFFGFINIRFYSFEHGDYEQFFRGHRVIVYAEKKK